MPGSVVQGKQEIKEWLQKQPDIKYIVDVGAGSATYPRLLGPEYHYIAIEIWEPYVEQFNLKQYYERIIIGDIRFVELPTADCIIFGDILEHLPKQDAEEILSKALNRYNHVVVSVPLSENSGEIRPAKIHYDNINEQHISGWTYEEFSSLYPWELNVFAGKNKMGIFAK